eukprot:13891512-Heterocapsa_arctica.AAC.1
MPGNRRYGTAMMSGDGYVADSDNCVKLGDNYRVAWCTAALAVVGPALVASRGGCPTTVKESDMLA